jgi:hypothetical protein
MLRCLCSPSSKTPSSIKAFFSTHNPTHRMRCLVRLTRSLAVPACLISLVQVHPGPPFVTYALGRSRESRLPNEQRTAEVAKRPAEDRANQARYLDQLGRHGSQFIDEIRYRRGIRLLTRARTEFCLPQRRRIKRARWVPHGPKQKRVEHPL